jgi:aminoglycoside/choline kinase family phosphotransferase
MMTSHATHTTQAKLAEPTPDRDALMQTFIRESGFAEHTLEPIAGDASRRRYVRVITPRTSYMVMDAPPTLEPISDYIAVCSFLFDQGYSAPRIIAKDSETGFLLLEDLGDDLFSSMLSHGAHQTEEETLYSEAIDLLATWHTTSNMQRGSAAIDLPLYSHSTLMREVELFADWYLPEVAAEKYSTLANEVLNIWRRILIKAPLADCYFVHRDFHASNLLWLPQRKALSRVGLLDFQDAVWGDPAYDLASLLEDARRDVAPELAQRMLKRYVDLTGQPTALLKERYAILAAQRNMKIIGIFHRLNQRDNKPAYLEFLPRVWVHLQNDLAHPALTELRKWMDASIPLDWRR